ncbi:hypothetical protein QVD17_08246 [Tagetes erecta]|uniref:Myb/SANT-like domain-containing protein n=1 Tax=Tagetes erecta TaxID=13708 RepID=A0AAD8KZZ5_TARER|nr:hypothetical protein QVD17_08246 [Tagetes erecta]
MCSVKVCVYMKRKPRISWQLEGVDKTFLEACIHELTLHGREGSSLKQASWKNVAEKLKQEHGFIADQPDWEIEMKYNKYVEALRRSPLAYPELCVQLFEGSISHGFDSWGPSSKLPHPS